MICQFSVAPSSINKGKAMSKRQPNAKAANKVAKPKEIRMTDLNWTNEADDRGHDGHEDSHAAGTPGGGTASGGLAGTNSGHGDPDDAELDGALGSGILDNDGEDEGRPPYAGSAGGAVGGTPAEKRVKGGHGAAGLSPGGDPPGDSTIGQGSKRDPKHPKRGAKK
jgi:hypothetical protein